MTSSASYLLLLSPKTAATAAMGSHGSLCWAKRRGFKLLIASLGKPRTRYTLPYTSVICFLTRLYTAEHYMLRRIQSGLFLAIFWPFFVIFGKFWLFRLKCLRRKKCICFSVRIFGTKKIFWGAPNNDLASLFLKGPTLRWALEVAPVSLGSLTGGAFSQPAYVRYHSLL